MDPFDELWLRILVGRVLCAVDAALDANGNAEVFSYRPESMVPAWSLIGHRTAHRLRRQRGDELLADEQCKGVGTLDIRHYYPSVTPDALASALASTSAAAGATVVLCEMLHGMGRLEMPRGLPIGPEASGILGNLMLMGVDAALSPLVQGHVRYTDDSWVFLDDEGRWPEVLRCYEDAAAHAGLAPNLDKLAFHSKEDGSADNAMSSSRVDSLIASAGGFVRPEMAAEEIEHQLSLPQPDWTAIRFGLGALARDGSASGLGMIYDNPTIFIEAPVNTANYLISLTRHGRHRAKINVDWLVDFATAEPDGRSIAARVHACRVAEQLSIGKQNGRQLEAVAVSGARPRNVPLQAWAAAAWGKSDAHKPGVAVDHATHVGDLALRRAFALSIDPATASRAKCRKWATHLSIVDPDLDPTVQHLRA